jgi:DprA winged helix domain
MCDLRSSPRVPMNPLRHNPHLYSGSGVGPHERKILRLLKADEATQIDEVVERLELEHSSSEIFAARFELELARKVRQLPGKNFNEGVLMETC